MSYEVQIPNDVGDALRRFRKPIVRDEVLEELARLSQDPHVGKKIQIGPSDLRGLLAHKFPVFKPPLVLRFSVVYKVDEDRKAILVAAIGVLRGESEKYIDLREL